MKLRIFELETEAATQQDCAAIIRAALGVNQVEAPATPPIPQAPVTEMAAEIAETPVERRPRRIVQVKTRKAIEAPAQRSAPGGGDSMPARVLEALKKKPLSSMELASALKVDVTKIYPACQDLKQKGLVESKNDDQGDGTRRYFVK